MKKLQITGGRTLAGVIKNQGAKNSVLPILSACILHRGETVLHNCPDITDVRAAISILQHLHCRVDREGDTVIIDASVADGTEIPDALMREMRSSVIFLGAVAARNGKAKLSLPGGCELGARPVNYHMYAMEQLGASCVVNDGHIFCRRLSHGKSRVRFPFPSVGATENAMLFACAEKQETVLTGVAKEPEILDLQGYLNALGFCVTGAGTEEIRISGEAKNKSVEYTILPDRICAATVLCAVAAAGGEVTVQNAVPAHLQTVLSCLTVMGCRVQAEENKIHLIRNGKLKGAGLVSTGPYPAFPTDSQPPLMACCLAGEGRTVFRENIFENRYRHVSQLREMGGRIQLSGQTALVCGGPLRGAEVQAGDLRGGAALCVAALAAEGCSTISGLHHIDRGYDSLETILRSLGGVANLLPD